MIVISDTSPITNLLRIGQLELLQSVYGNIIIPQSVYNELCQLEHQKEIIDQLSWIQVSGISNTEMLKQLLIDLDKGEAESIIIAMELKADYLVIDEAKGRLIAESFGLKIVGLLGTLIKAKQDGILTAVKPLLDDLNQIGFRIHNDLYNHILNISNEL